MRGRDILNKKEEDKNNFDCQNCPYFINKIICPVHRKARAEGHKSYDSGASEAPPTGRGFPAM
jgi:hypothetical protein